MPSSVTVRVPATSANLGPGFDCLGLALRLTAEATLALRPDGEAQGPIEAMAVAAARAAYRAAERPEPEELACSWQGDLPIARGLGVSAAARAAGLVGANALMGKPLSDDDLLELGAPLEGHADNMAPALFGGLQIVVDEGRAWRRLAVPLPPGMKIVLLVPDFEMPTQQSRSKLPAKVSLEEAVFNVGRAALLVAALAQGRWELLDAATKDKLHQPARSRIFPALYDIFDAAKLGGARAAYLSGGGSTVAALVETGSDEGRVARLMEQAAKARGYSVRMMFTEPSAEGARVVDSH